jgi:hypothetical protein
VPIPDPASGGSSIELSEWVRWGKLEARARVVGNLLWSLLSKRGGKEMLAVIYVFGISVVGAFLFAAVNAFEPNRRYAFSSSSLWALRQSQED